METKSTNSEKNYASLIHLSALSKYFIPFGNYILPIILWSPKKDSSTYINESGKQILNFQLSILLYSLVLLLISVPTLLITVFRNIDLSIFEKEEIFFEHLPISNLNNTLIFAIIAILLFVVMKIAEFFLIIYGAIKSNNGESYKYPLTIHFIK